MLIFDEVVKFYRSFLFLSRIYRTIIIENNGIKNIDNAIILFFYNARRWKNINK